jgi:antitoxin MazE
MRTKIKKWGNSLAVRIPKPFVKEAQLAYGISVDLAVEDGKIIIDPRVSPEYRLEDLLREVNNKNLHLEIDSGEAVGREAW